MTDYIDEIKEVLRLSSDLTEEQMAQISNDTNMTEIGLDSLSLVEAVIELESRFKIQIDLHEDWMEDEVITINGLNKMINEKLND